MKKLKFILELFLRYSLKQWKKIGFRKISINSIEYNSCTKKQFTQVKLKNYKTSGQLITILLCYKFKFRRGPLFWKQCFQPKQILSNI